MEADRGPPGAHTETMQGASPPEAYTLVPPDPMISLKAKEVLGTPVLRTDPQ